jgi:hypothetical protein
MLKKLHELSLHVVNLVGNQNQKMQVMSAEQSHATEHHKPASNSSKKITHTEPQKSHTQQ